MWLTMTPARLTMPISAMKPKDACVVAKPMKAPMSPSGTVSITTSDFMIERNWITIASAISASEIFSTRSISRWLFVSSRSSPPNAMPSFGKCSRAFARMREASSPNGASAFTVIVRR